jgi:hypothetical protein
VKLGGQNNRTIERHQRIVDVTLLQLSEAEVEIGRRRRRIESYSLGESFRRFLPLADATCLCTLLKRSLKLRILGGQRQRYNQNRQIADDNFRPADPMEDRDM